MLCRKGDSHWDAERERGRDSPLMAVTPGRRRMQRLLAPDISSKAAFPHISGALKIYQISLCFNRWTNDILLYFSFPFSFCSQFLREWQRKSKIIIALTNKCMVKVWAQILNLLNTSSAHVEIFTWTSILVPISTLQNSRSWHNKKYISWISKHSLWSKGLRKSHLLTPSDNELRVYWTVSIFDFWINKKWIRSSNFISCPNPKTNNILITLRDADTVQTGSVPPYCSQS